MIFSSKHRYRRRNWRREGSWWTGGHLVLGRPWQRGRHSRLQRLPKTPLPQSCLQTTEWRRIIKEYFEEVREVSAEEAGAQIEGQEVVRAVFVLAIRVTGRNIQRQYYQWSIRKSCYRQCAIHPYGRKRTTRRLLMVSEEEIYKDGGVVGCGWATEEVFHHHGFKSRNFP